MLHHLRSIWHKVGQQEEGASLIVFAFSFMVLLAAAGLAVDGSYAYLQRRHMQNAADAAALAGVRRLALGQALSAIGVEIESIATTNGASTVTWQLIDNASGVHVTASVSYETWFVGVFGYQTTTIGAESEAKLVSISSIGNLMPMTTMCTEEGFQDGHIYTLWDNDPNAPGNFGWLDWNGPPVGVPELAANIAEPSNSGVWHIGDQIPGGPGVKNSSQVIAALALWIGRSVTIPLYSSVSGSGANTTYEVCGFAEFVLTGYKFQGGDKWVQGRFVRLLAHGGTVSGDHPNYGLTDAIFTR
jgi:hypothetical protein